MESLHCLTYFHIHALLQKTQLQHHESYPPIDHHVCILHGGLNIFFDTDTLGKFNNSPCHFQVVYNRRNPSQRRCSLILLTSNRLPLKQLTHGNPNFTPSWPLLLVLHCANCINSYTPLSYLSLMRVEMCSLMCVKSNVFIIGMNLSHSRRFNFIIFQ